MFRADWLRPHWSKQVNSIHWPQLQQQNQWLVVLGAQYPSEQMFVIIFQSHVKTRDGEFMDGISELAPKVDD